MRIGVVNDMPLAIEAIRRVLTPAHQLAWTACDGAEAVQSCAEDRPDLILMDLIMPVMDGVACIEQIFNFDPDANIAIISGYEKEGIEDLSEKTKASIIDYIAKPVGLSDLSATLARMIR